MAHLNQRVGLAVSAAAGLVQKQNLGATQERATHAEELALADREVGAILYNRGLELRFHQLDSTLHVRFLCHHAD